MPPETVVSRTVAVDAVIITALVEEHQALVKAFTGPEPVKAVSPFVAKVGDMGVALYCIASQGNVTAAMATQTALKKWDPSIVVLCGIAGGLNAPGERELGDVLVADQVVYYELEKKTAGAFRPRYEAFRADRALLRAAKLLDPEEWVHSIGVERPDGTQDSAVPTAHYGVVASGEKVVADDTFIRELQQAWPKLIGVEMESVGLAKACDEADPPVRYIVIKAISDWADAAKDDRWHAYAAASAASFARALLAQVVAEALPDDIEAELDSLSRRLEKRYQANPDRALGSDVPLRLWRAAIDSFRDTMLHPARVAYNLQYSVSMSETADGWAIETDDHVSRTFPGVERVFLSICSNNRALDHEYLSQNHGCLAREIVERGPSESVEAWRDRVVAAQNDFPCQLSVDGDPIEASEPEFELVGDDAGILRIYFDMAHTDLPKKITPIRHRMTFHLDKGQNEFPIRFNSYYCVGPTSITFVLQTLVPRPPIQPDVFLSSIGETPFSFRERRSSGSRQELSLQTKGETVLPPGSGVMFRWRDPDE